MLVESNRDHVSYRLIRICLVFLASKAFVSDTWLLTVLSFAMAKPKKVSSGERSGRVQSHVHQHENGTSRRVTSDCALQRRAGCLLAVHTPNPAGRDADPRTRRAPSPRQNIGPQIVRRRNIRLQLIYILIL